MGILCRKHSKQSWRERFRHSQKQLDLYGRNAIARPLLRSSQQPFGMIELG